MAQFLTAHWTQIIYAGVGLGIYLLFVAWSAIGSVTWNISHRRWVVYSWLPLLALVMWIVRYRKEQMAWRE